MGQAVVKLQGRIARPFEIKGPGFVVEKGKITDNYIKEHMQYIAPTIPEEDFPAGNTIVNAKTVKSSDNELTFLKDVQEYPESGIAARYKRIGLSVRQGQKLKAKLLRENLFEEEEIYNKIGRLRRIGLTARGRQKLASFK